jgi:hypothetical protein
LSITNKWLENQGLTVAKVLEWLNSNGGYCDCEALANSEQAWEEATKNI